MLHRSHEVVLSIAAVLAFALVAPKAAAAEEQILAPMPTAAGDLRAALATGRRAESAHLATITLPAQEAVHVTPAD